MVWPDGLGVVLGWKPRREVALAIGARQEIVQVPGKLTVRRRSIRVERIHMLEVRRAGVQAFAVDHQMPIVPNAHLLAAHGHHALDVKVTRDMRMVYAFGFEN